MRKTGSNRPHLVAIIILFFAGVVPAQVSSPFNKLIVKDTSADYSFLVSGHFHGASTNISTYPASTLLANLDTLNSINASFLMSLGDMFIDVDETYIDHYQKSLFSRLKMPLFNAAGNHDISNGNIYEKVYGRSFYSFAKGSEIFIILNTELADGSITGEQLVFFKRVLDGALKSEVRNIFIFSHRPVWAENNKRYKDLFAGNTRTAIGSNNFETDIMPLLSKFPEAKQVYWMSGSLGGGPASFFYDHPEGGNITFIQTAIRDLPRDAVLRVDIKQGAVSFSGISLTGQKLGSIGSYDVSYWEKTIAPEEQFNFRMLPFYGKQMLLHYYFWTGFVVSLLLFMFCLFVRKRWKRNR